MLGSNRRRQPQKSSNRAQWRLTNVKQAIALLLLIILTSGCAVGPNYQRPKVDVPPAYRGSPSLEPENPQQASEHSSSGGNASLRGGQAGGRTPQAASVPSEQSFGD